MGDSTPPSPTMSLAVDPPSAAPFPADVHPPPSPIAPRCAPTRVAPWRSRCSTPPTATRGFPGMHAMQADMELIPGVLVDAVPDGLSAVFMGAEAGVGPMDMDDVLLPPTPPPPDVEASDSPAALLPADAGPPHPYAPAAVPATDMDKCHVCDGYDEREDDIVCDGCDRGFHLECLGLASVPEGEWYCSSCGPEARPPPSSPHGGRPPDVARALGGECGVCGRRGSQQLDPSGMPVHFKCMASSASPSALPPASASLLSTPVQPAAPTAHADCTMGGRARRASDARPGPGLGCRHPMLAPCQESPPPVSMDPSGPRKKRFTKTAGGSKHASPPPSVTPDVSAGLANGVKKPRARPPRARPSPRISGGDGSAAPADPAGDSTAKPRSSKSKHHPIEAEPGKSPKVQAVASVTPKLTKALRRKKLHEDSDSSAAPAEDCWACHESVEDWSRHVHTKSHHMSMRPWLTEEVAIVKSVTAKMDSPLWQAGSMANPSYQLDLREAAWLVLWEAGEDKDACAIFDEALARGLAKPFVTVFQVASMLEKELNSLAGRSPFLDLGERRYTLRSIQDTSVARMVLSPQQRRLGMTVIPQSPIRIVPDDTVHHWLRWGPSTIAGGGLGLFVREHRIEEGTVFCRYAGIKMSIRRSQKRHWSYQVAVTAEKVDGELSSVIDGLDNGQVLSYGPLANDAGPGFQNAEYVEFKELPGQVFLQSLRDLKPGEEVFLCYGEEYWALDQYPSVSAVDSAGMLADLSAAQGSTTQHRVAGSKQAQGSVGKPSISGPTKSKKKAAQTVRLLPPGSAANSAIPPDESVVCSWCNLPQWKRVMMLHLKICPYMAKPKDYKTGVHQIMSRIRSNYVPGDLLQSFQLMNVDVSKLPPHDCMPPHSPEFVPGVYGPRLYESQLCFRLGHLSRMRPEYITTNPLVTIQYLGEKAVAFKSAPDEPVQDLASAEAEDEAARAIIDGPDPPPMMNLLLALFEQTPGINGHTARGYIHRWKNRQGSDSDRTFSVLQGMPRAVRRAVLTAAKEMEENPWAALALGPPPGPYLPFCPVPGFPQDTSPPMYFPHTVPTPPIPPSLSMVMHKSRSIPMQQQAGAPVPSEQPHGQLDPTSATVSKPDAISKQELVNNRQYCQPGTTVSIKVHTQRARTYPCSTASSHSFPSAGPITNKPAEWKEVDVLVEHPTKPFDSQWVRDPVTRRLVLRHQNEHPGSTCARHESDDMIPGNHQDETSMQPLPQPQATSENAITAAQPDITSIEHKQDTLGSCQTRHSDTKTGALSGQLQPPVSGVSFLGLSVPEAALLPMSQGNPAGPLSSPPPVLKLENTAFSVAAPVSPAAVSVDTLPSSSVVGSLPCSSTVASQQPDAMYVDSPPQAQNRPAPKSPPSVHPSLPAHPNTMRRSTRSRRWKMLQQRTLKLQALDTIQWLLANTSPITTRAAGVMRKIAAQAQGLGSHRWAPADDDWAADLSHNIERNRQYLETNPLSCLVPAFSCTGYYPYIDVRAPDLTELPEFAESEGEGEEPGASGRDRDRGPKHHEKFTLAQPLQVESLVPAEWLYESSASDGEGDAEAEAGIGSSKRPKRRRTASGPKSALDLDFGMGAWSSQDDWYATLKTLLPAICATTVSVRSQGSTPVVPEPSSSDTASPAAVQWVRDPVTRRMVMVPGTGRVDETTAEQDLDMPNPQHTACEDSELSCKSALVIHPAMLHRGFFGDQVVHGGTTITCMKQGGGGGFLQDSNVSGLDQEGLAVAAT
eukprot:gene4333-787_t